MVKLPAELIPLNKWIVYKAPLPENSPKSHTIVIIYRTESEIKYFYFTSQVKKAEMRYRDDKEALVKIQKSSWDTVLTEDVSCIQCGRGHLYSIDVEDLKKLYDAGQMTIVGELPEDIKQKVKTAINASVTYNFVEQSKLTREEE